MYFGKKQEGGSAGELDAICVLLLVLQLLRMGAHQVIYWFAQPGSVEDSIWSSAFFLLLSLAVMGLGRVQNMSVRVLPASPKGRTVSSVLTVLTLAFLIATPLLAVDWSVGTLWSLFYGAVATPVYEELLFRGYAWERFLQAGYSQGTTYACTTLLFALWHLGYADTVFIRLQMHGGGQDLFFILLMKAAVGLGYGIVLGFVRSRTKSCLPAILLHSVLNAFGR